MYLLLDALLGLSAIPFVTSYIVAENIYSHSGPLRLQDYLHDSNEERLLRGIAQSSVLGLHVAVVTHFCVEKCYTPMAVPSNITATPYTDLRSLNAAG